MMILMKVMADETQREKTIECVLKQIWMFCERVFHETKSLSAHSLTWYETTITAFMHIDTHYKYT